MEMSPTDCVWLLLDFTNYFTDTSADNFINFLFLQCSSLVKSKIQASITFISTFKKHRNSYWVNNNKKSILLVHNFPLTLHYEITYNLKWNKMEQNKMNLSLWNEAKVTAVSSQELQVRLFGATSCCGSMFPHCDACVRLSIWNICRYNQSVNCVFEPFKNTSVMFKWIRPQISLPKAIRAYTLK